MSCLPSVRLNKTFTHIIEHFSFGDLPRETCIELFKDGRVFSHFIEVWLEKHYPLTHVKGCKAYDFKDNNDETILYDEKTFTRNGCQFCPSSMLGAGRKFNQEEFIEKTSKLIFCFVSNVNFPEIKIKFIRGIDLLKIYPKGSIPFNNHIIFFD